MITTKKIQAANCTIVQQYAAIALPCSFALLGAILDAGIFGSASAYGADRQEMHRLYNPNSGEHFYTADAAERDHLTNAGWSYEGVGVDSPVIIGFPRIQAVQPERGGPSLYPR